MEKNKISIVVPCFNEKEALPLFYNKITQVFNQMSQESETAGLSYELIIVDDGSSDGTLDVAKELATNDSGVKYISFSRNFGKEAAMYAGLQHAVGEYVAIMDADLQDPPEMLPKMYQVLTKEGYDAVGTRRVTRKGEPSIEAPFGTKARNRPLCRSFWGRSQEVYGWAKKTLLPQFSTWAKSANSLPLSTVMVLKTRMRLPVRSHRCCGLKAAYPCRFPSSLSPGSPPQEE